MTSIIVKFHVNAGECILHTQKVLESIKLECGELSSTYKDLLNNKPTSLEISAILFDSPTKIEIRYDKDSKRFAQDLIEDSIFTYPKSTISNVISTQSTNGTLYLVIQ